MKIGTDKHGIIITIPNFIGKTYADYNKWIIYKYNQFYPFDVIGWDYKANCKNYAELYPLSKNMFVVLIDIPMEKSPSDPDMIKRQLYRLDDETIEL